MGKMSYLIISLTANLSTRNVVQKTDKIYLLSIITQVIKKTNKFPWDS